MANFQGEEKTRAFCRNTGSQISETKQLGDLGIEDYWIRFDLEPGGKTWWRGPYDEAKEFIICKDVPDENQPTELPQGPIGTVQFWSTQNLAKTASGDDIITSSFVTLVNDIENTSYTSGYEAYNYLLSEGYWSNFITESGHQYKPSNDIFPPADATSGFFNSSTNTFYIGSGDDLDIGGLNRFKGFYITSQSNGTGQFLWQNIRLRDSNSGPQNIPSFYAEYPIYAITSGSDTLHTSSYGRFVFGFFKDTAINNGNVGIVKFDTNNNRIEDYHVLGTSDGITQPSSDISQNSYFYEPITQVVDHPSILFGNKKGIYAVPTTSIGKILGSGSQVLVSPPSNSNRVMTGFFADIPNHYIYWCETFATQPGSANNSLQIYRSNLKTLLTKELLWEGNPNGKRVEQALFSSIAPDYEKAYITVKYTTGDQPYRTYVFSLKLNNLIYPLFSSPEASASAAIYDEHNKVVWAIDSSYNDGNNGPKNLLGLDPTVDERFIKYTFTASLSSDRPDALRGVFVNTNDDRLIISNDYLQNSNGGKYITTENFPGYW